MTFQYLALGDSYTICTGASRQEAGWPALIAQRLAEATAEPVQVTNLGVNGYTTRDLIRDELPHLGDQPWSLVTVLIGVNDFVQRVPRGVYGERLREIYDGIVTTAASVVAVSIPDFSFAPTAELYADPGEIRTGLADFNSLAQTEASARGFRFVDIFEVSRSAIGSPGWISADGLHPGDAQYLAWADQIWGSIGPVWRPWGPFTK